MKATDYKIEIIHTQEDGGYVALLPAFESVSAHGDTPSEAVEELGVALAAVIDAMEEQGKPLPSPDSAQARIKALAPVINTSALARCAGINPQTLTSKLSRGTPFSIEEESRLRKILCV